jgi:hypothetical protein
VPSTFLQNSYQETTAQISFEVEIIDPCVSTSFVVDGFVVHDMETSVLKDMIA